MVRDRRSYYHMRGSLNDHIATSKVVVVPFLTPPWEKFTDKGNTVLVLYSKICSQLQFGSTHREKEGMKVESTALAGQREVTCREEKERLDKDLDFFPSFLLL